MNTTNIVRNAKLRPLQQYRLNDNEIFTVGQIDGKKVFGSVTPIECLNESFVLINRHVWLNIEQLEELELLKQFRGLWNGKIYV